MNIRIGSYFGSNQAQASATNSFISDNNKTTKLVEILTKTYYKNKYGIDIHLICKGQAKKSVTKQIFLC